jgi:hypothetical protein
LDGAVVGGAEITCLGVGCEGQGTGVLYISGVVDQFSIGGQEFAVDHVCPSLPLREEPEQELR